MFGFTPRFRAHMSIAGGLEKAFAAGVGAGCDCIQILVKNQRQRRAPGLSAERIATFEAPQRESGPAPVLAHAPCMINLASTTAPRSIRSRRRCYELLCFQPAFPGADDKEILGAIIARDPTPPRRIRHTVPDELDTICLSCMEKSPDARYNTARRLADDLRRYIHDLAADPRAVGFSPDPRPDLGRAIRDSGVRIAMGGTVKRRLAVGCNTSRRPLSRKRSARIVFLTVPPLDWGLEIAN